MAFSCNQAPTIVDYRNYIIFFSNQSEYNFAVSVAGGTTIKTAPGSAAGLFSCPIYTGTFPTSTINFGTPPGKGIIIDVNGVDAPPNFDVGWQNGPTPHVFLNENDNVASVGCVINSTNDNYTFPNKNVVWLGAIVFVNPNPTPTPQPVIAVPKRRWITGFEFEFGAEGGGNSGLIITRDASRVVDGLGAAIRSSTNKNFTRPTNVYRAGLTPTSSWERIYCRVRQFGIAAIDIWKSQSSPSPTSGGKLYINPDGSISVYNVNSFAVETLLATTPVIFALNIFHRIDILINYNPLSTLGSGRIRVYVDGVALTDNVVLAASGGLGQNSTYHLQTTLGTVTATANVWELDFDDWINADIPNDGVNESLNSIDWFVGSHVQKVRTNSATLSNWTGQYEELNQMISPINVSTNARLTSSVALASIVGTTDLGLNSFTGLLLFSAAAIISKYGTRVTNNGQLGYSLAGAGAVLSTVVESAAAQYNTVAYLGTGTDAIPQGMVPFTINYIKGNGSDLNTLYAAQAVVEQVGVWGIEDNVNAPASNGVYLLHNGAYYSNTKLWAINQGPPDNSGVTCAIGNTYVGNGTQQSIFVDIPFHFLFVRPLTGGINNGFKWFATGLSGHLDGKDGCTPESPVNVFFSPTLGPGFTVVGNGADVNANGVTYQYIVFADPGMRYNYCGCFLHSTANSSALNPLIDPAFTPLAVFFQNENSPALSTNIILAYKGPGSSGANGNRIDGTALSALATLATGSITSGLDAHKGQQTTFSAWRTIDGTQFVAVQILSYIGNGSSPRTITLTPTSGRFPLFAYVQPHNALGIFRDPSHAGSNSGRMTDSTNNITTGITAGGIDNITVGSTLNSNGIVYDVFVICGSTLGWNNGEFCTGFVPPDVYVTPPSPPLPDIAVIGEGGIIMGGSTPISLLKDISGIYTLIPGQRHDTLQDRQTGQTTVDVDIPNPEVKGGYIGG